MYNPFYSEAATEPDLLAHWILQYKADSLTAVTSTYECSTYTDYKDPFEAFVLCIEASVSVIVFCLLFYYRADNTYHGTSVYYILTSRASTDLNWCIYTRIKRFRGKRNKDTEKMQKCCCKTYCSAGSFKGHCRIKGRDFLNFAMRANLCPPELMTSLGWGEEEVQAKGFFHVKIWDFWVKHNQGRFVTTKNERHNAGVVYGWGDRWSYWG